MDEKNVLDLLESSGALRKGHFKLSSGRHSDTYVQCALLLSDPDAAVRVGSALAEKVEGEVDLVLCPALGAVVIGFTVALALGVGMVFAERHQGKMELRRGFEITGGSRVLLVEDVITTGGSIMELARMVEEECASVTALSCVVDRGKLNAGEYPLYSLVRLEVASYPSDECPLCARGVPIDAPGSRYKG